MSTLDTVKHYCDHDDSYKSHYGKYIQAYRPKKDADLENYLLNLIKPQVNESILDCGCGFGSVSELLSSKCKNVTALNICKSQLPKSRNKVIYKHGDFDQINTLFNDKLFDKIIFLETMGYTSNLTNLIYQCKQALTHKGKIIMKELFNKEVSSHKILELQTKQKDFVKSFYNYTILDKVTLVGELQACGIRLLNIQKPNFECDWSSAFNFERHSLPNHFPKIIHKNTQKDNLFECLEIIAEKT